MENNLLNMEEAYEFISKVEKERIAFRNTIGGINTETDLFDIFINRATFDDEDTIYLIFKAVYISIKKICRAGWIVITHHRMHHRYGIFKFNAS